METTYFAYETKNGKAVKVLRSGAYDEVASWAKKREASIYKKTKIHNPIWVDSIIHALQSA